MKGRDARSLDHITLEYIRFQAVKAVREGHTVREVARIFGVHRSRVHEWVKLARGQGMEALKAKPVPGNPPKLDDQQQKVLTLWVCVFTPLAFGFDSTRWTTEIIKELIEKEFSIHMSRSAVGRLLHRLEITPQRPIRRAVERDPVVAAHWVNEEFPKIKELAAKEGATIYFLDEAGVCTDYHAGTTWSLEGLTPVIPATGGRYRVNMIATVTAEGELDFQVGTQSLNGSTFVEYLKRLAQETSHPLWIVMDRYSVHRSKVVEEYLKTTHGKVKIVLLPAYCPHLNPVELVWNNIKAQKITRYFIRSVEELTNKVTPLLESLKSIPKKVQAFFREESVRYAL